MTAELVVEQDLLNEPGAKWMGHATARRAVDVLLAHDRAYRRPSGKERQALLVGYAMCGKTLFGAAFDVVRLDQEIDLSDPQAIANGIESITICEVKSTAQTSVKPDLSGYFFNITGAEHLTAQSVGQRYRFVFVNTLTGSHQEMSLNDVFGRARGMYPAWHIRF